MKGEEEARGRLPKNLVAHRCWRDRLAGREEARATRAREREMELEGPLVIVSVMADAMLSAAACSREPTMKLLFVSGS